MIPRYRIVVHYLWQRWMLLRNASIQIFTDTMDIRALNLISVRMPSRVSLNFSGNWSTIAVISEIVVCEDSSWLVHVSRVSMQLLLRPFAIRSARTFQRAI